MATPSDQPVKPKRRRGRGEGSIEHLPSGNWRAIISLGKDPETGQRIKLSATFERKGEALDWRDEQKTLFATGKMRPNSTTFAEYATRWLALKKMEWKESNADYHQLIYDRHLKDSLGSERMAKLSQDRLEQWLTELNTTADQKRRAVAMLRSVLKAASVAGLVRDNHALRIPKPKKVRREMKFWTVDEVRAVVRECGKRKLGAMFILFLDTGARVGELLGLHWPAVDLETGHIRITHTLDERRGQFTLTPPKTEKAKRKVKLSRVAIEALQRHRRTMEKAKQDTTTGPVFLAASGGFIPRWTFARHYFRKMVKAAGVPMIRPHDMRHTNATLLLADPKVKNVKVISERLGHEDIVTTLRLYAHVMSHQQDDAAEAIGGILQTTVPRMAQNRVKNEVLNLT